MVVLTGAGISAESGLATFRDAEGLWENHRIEDVATPEAFVRRPELVQRFYNARRHQLVHGDIQPNAAHRALVRLEKEWEGEFLLVTQNIDDLHERAGSQNLIHLHGELRKVRCLACGFLVPWDEEIVVGSRCPGCGESDSLRPHVVWFGEMPLELDRIGAALSRCDLFLAIGTSGHVYPAAGFVESARYQGGARCIEFNLSATEISDAFHEHHLGRSGDLLPGWVENFLRD
ncbi:MAG: Sir2 family NAD+-dependent deacetylase [Verrucomicrobiota bacterium]